MKCPICAKELESNLTSCPFCGTPLKVEGDEYKKTEFIVSQPTGKKASKERAHAELIQKNRTIAGFCSIFSFPLMLGALIFMLFTFMTFNPGTANETPGITYVPYSICFLVPSFILAVVAFFKSKDASFKSANRIAAVEVIINGLLTIFGFVILMLVTSGTI
jgi:hypothetical protein